MEIIKRVILFKKVFTGLGPGGLTITKLDFPLQTRCVPGSSHGGKAPSERPIWLDSGPPYDKQNITSLLGGSGGEAKFFYACINSQFIRH